MIRYYLLTVFFMHTLAVISQPDVRIRITSLPEYHPAGSDIYLAGSFNGWNPADPAYRLAKDEQGDYRLAWKLAPGSYEYKVTRGGWDKAECKKGGKTSANRVLQVDTALSLDIEVEEWADRFPAQPKKSTASPQVQIIDTAFLIPQLSRTRRVWIYLPQNYESSTGERWPVLYLQDGQNVFDDATSYSGEWGVDEFLDTALSRSSIVVAVDHGGNKRLNEYNPYHNERFGKGEGDAYVDFLVKTLKPFIDNRYRTKKDKSNTFIAGSSMGGLISFYAVLKYPKVFGGAGIFSPAFWIAGPKLFDDIKKSGRNINARLFFYGGRKEGATMVPDMERAANEVKKLSKAAVEVVVRDDGEHNEANWRREFPSFYRFLLNANQN